MASVLGATPTAQPAVAGAGDNNAPLTDLFEPGSTNKLITLSWALEHGHVTADTKFLVPESIQVEPHVAPYHDAEPHTGVPNGIEKWTTAGWRTPFASIVAPRRCGGRVTPPFAIVANASSICMPVTATP